VTTNLPTGATVTTLGAGLLLLAGVRRFIRRGARADAEAERAA
jgi:hypothetical protein